MELFVLDDGWFGKRDEDKSVLGDWIPNEKKLGCTLRELGDRILKTGMRFGLWLEPEGLSEDSNLYRAHPDWAVTIPERSPCLSRSQLVLDFSRTDVQDYMLQTLSNLLSSAPISYIKWDFNRSICDKFSRGLPAERQGEFSHRYVLGLYRVLEELTAQFPQILFESCCAGGGRFDAEMLYYTPQIWASDTTGAIERLRIQYGISFGYSVSCTSSHAAASSSHQTGRTAPFSTRAAVAMLGNFGYELDPRGLTDSETTMIRQQISGYKKWYDLIHQGSYYRLTAPSQPSCTVWKTAAPDGKTALITAVYHHVQANPVPVRIRIQGLRDNAIYRVFVGEKVCEAPGSALRQCGLVVPAAREEYQVWQIVLEILSPC